MAINRAIGHMEHNDTTATDWKRQYRELLAQQGQQEQGRRELMSLLVRALLRMAVVAEGIEPALDKQLGGLKVMLKNAEPETDELGLLVTALDGQIKRLDSLKTAQGRQLRQDLVDMLQQLKSLKPDDELLAAVRGLKKRVQRDPLYTMTTAQWLQVYSDLQRQVLAQARARQPHTGLLAKWFAAPSLTELDTPALPVLKSVPTRDDQERSESVAAPDYDAVPDLVAPQHSAAPADEAGQPCLEQQEAAAGGDQAAVEAPFSRISDRVCAVLADLLRQIEPPAMAKENYRAVEQQMARGLNWYELVPTLEHFSLVVVSAFDRDQREFEQFLQQLNERLSTAYALISHSQRSDSERRDADQRLNQAMRAQFSAIQQQVEQATELDQLKTRVSSSLDQIIAAMDQHQAAERSREVSLSEQLNALVERVRHMEQESAVAEQRIAEQRERALRDVLTQLPNREAYQQQLAQEYARWQRYARPLSLVVCDIDHFKRINDEYGHLAGDKVLRIIAKGLAKRLRETDFVARYGGEEFVLLLPETDAGQAELKINAMREAIALSPFHFKEQPVSITLSFGISEFYPGDEPAVVFERADQALYAAKQGGRNCCRVAAQAG